MLSRLARPTFAATASAVRSRAVPAVVRAAAVPARRFGSYQREEQQQRQRQRTTTRWGALGLGLALSGAVVTVASATEAQKPAAANTVLDVRTATPGAIKEKSEASKAEDWEAIRKELEELIDSNPDYDDGSYGPLLLRLAWHASGTYSHSDRSGGSEGALIRFAPQAGWGANKGLALAVQLLENIKKRHPGISYADLYTFAGVVAVEYLGGPKIKWRPGRVDFVDGAKSPADGRLPDAAKDSKHVREIFYRMGFTDQEIVALAGAHSLGRCHRDRSGYEGPWSRSPTTFSNEYYRLLLEEKWVPKKWDGPLQYENENGRDLMMLPADLAFRDDPAFRKFTEVYAKDEKKFFDDFASAYAKLLELGVAGFHPAAAVAHATAGPAGAAVVAVGPAALPTKDGAPAAAAKSGGGFFSKIFGGGSK